MTLLSQWLAQPLFLVAFLVALLALVFYLSRIPALAPVFKKVPPLIFAYFVPMICTTAGLTPQASPVYTFASSYVLLASLFLLMVTVDLRAILQLGPLALLTMLAGTLGIMVGAPIAFLLLKPLLPPDAWMGMAVLSGSWIGGTANMVAIQQMIGAPSSIMSPAIVVDTVVGYGWIGLLVFLSAYEEKFDRWSRARVDVLARVRADAARHKINARPTSVADLAVVCGLGLGAAVVARGVGLEIPPLTTGAGADAVTVVTSSTWGILIVVTVGLVLSFTRLRRLDDVGGSDVGYLALYFLLATIGAQADLAAIGQSPYFVLAGAVWLSVHAVIIFALGRLLRAPLALIAVSSAANVGGPASAPVVGGVYHPAMAPVGLLLAIAGYILGIYAGFATASLLAWLAG